MRGIEKTVLPSNLSVQIFRRSSSEAFSINARVSCTFLSNVSSSSWRVYLHVVNRHCLPVATAFCREAGLRVIHQNLAHGHRGNRKKVGPALERFVAAPEQPYIGFVDQRGGLQCVPVRLPDPIPPRGINSSSACWSPPVQAESRRVTSPDASIVFVHNTLTLVMLGGQLCPTTIPCE